MGQYRCGEGQMEKSLLHMGVEDSEGPGVQMTDFPRCLTWLNWNERYVAAVRCVLAVLYLRRTTWREVSRQFWGYGYGLEPHPTTNTQASKLPTTRLQMYIQTPP